MNLRNLSDPACVLANAAINEPKATTIAPIPVEINATFKIFKALEKPPEAVEAAFVAVALAFCACA